ncbi:MAG TPA: hypothetical protein VGZ00_00795 [Candidatus Baltobacteraceae bacterium]|jgi:hypothetical protein|nr:hypothetical protein [Candidatus Baltobacteraceae bacterium]
MPSPDTTNPTPSAQLLDCFTEIARKLAERQRDAEPRITDLVRQISAIRATSWMGSASAQKKVSSPAGRSPGIISSLLAQREKEMLPLPPVTPANENIFSYGKMPWERDKKPDMFVIDNDSFIFSKPEHSFSWTVGDITQSGYISSPFPIPFSRQFCRETLKTVLHDLETYYVQKLHGRDPSQPDFASFYDASLCGWKGLLALRGKEAFRIGKYQRNPSGRSSIAIVVPGPSHRKMAKNIAYALGAGGRILVIGSSSFQEWAADTSVHHAVEMEREFVRWCLEKAPTVIYQQERVFIEQIALELGELQNTWNPRFSNGYADPYAESSYQQQGEAEKRNLRAEPQRGPYSKMLELARALEKPFRNIPFDAAPNFLEGNVEVGRYIRDYNSLMEPELRKLQDFRDLVSSEPVAAILEGEDWKDLIKRIIAETDNVEPLQERPPNERLLTFIQSRPFFCELFKLDYTKFQEKPLGAVDYNDDFERANHERQFSEKKAKVLSDLAEELLDMLESPEFIRKCRKRISDHLGGVPSIFYPSSMFDPCGPSKNDRVLPRSLVTAFANRQLAVDIYQHQLFLAPKVSADSASSLTEKQEPRPRSPLTQRHTG